jgi:hypothetical protein
MDAATTPAPLLIGLHLTEVRRRDSDWSFAFGDSVSLTAECPWRILSDGRIAHADTDDGQKFGLPAPVDGEEKTLRLLRHATIQRITIRGDTGDLSIAFGTGKVLEIINNSSGYEGWHIASADFEVIAPGGGELAIFSMQDSRWKKA